MDGEFEFDRECEDMGGFGMLGMTDERMSDEDWKPLYERVMLSGVPRGKKEKEMEDLEEKVRMLSLFGMAVTVLECERENERKLKGDREDKLPTPIGQNVTMPTASTNNRLYPDLLRTRITPPTIPD